MRTIFIIITNERSSADQVAGQPRSISLSQVSLNHWSVLVWAELMRSPKETWTVCVHGGSEEKTAGRESRRTVFFEGRKDSPCRHYEGSLCTWRRNLYWTSLPGVLLKASVQAHIKLTCSRYSLRFLDPLGPKTQIFELGMWAVLFLSSAKEACVKTSQFIVQRVLMLAE